MKHDMKQFLGDGVSPIPMALQRHHNAAQASALDQNMAMRRLVIQNSINMLQQTFTTSLSSNIPGTVLNIPLRQVGLLKRIYVELVFTVARSAAETQTRTAFGPANCLSQIVLNDLNNNTRVQTAGWHLNNLATARRGRVFGAAYTTDTPTGWGANFTTISAPSSFTTGNQTVRMYYEIPVAYSDLDLRGAMWLNVVNATAYLQLTINPNFFVSSTGSQTLAVYKSSSADLGTISAATVNVYQEYLGQVPMGQGGPMLPLLDLAHVYLLNNTAQPGLSANQDMPIPFANFRDFMSLFLIYDQAGTLNTGSDINTLALQSANYTNIFQYNANMAALLTRNALGDDAPAGTYYFDFRTKPLITQQYGNLQLVVNPASVAGATSQFLIGFEAIALQNQVVQAGSLSPGT